MLDFANGRIKLLARFVPASSWSGASCVISWAAEPGTEAKVVRCIATTQSSPSMTLVTIQDNDEVFFLASSENAKAMTGQLRGNAEPYKAHPAGGRLATSAITLRNRWRTYYQIKIIDRKNQAHQVFCRRRLNKTIVLQGDAADQDMLREENIEDVDVFCALTNDDEANILSSMLAKRLGANKVMSLINRPSYVELVESGIVDIAISPRQVTLGTLLAHVRKGDVVAVHSLRRGAAEALRRSPRGSQDLQGGRSKDR